MNLPTKRGPRLQSSTNFALRPLRKEGRWVGFGWAPLWSCSAWRARPKNRRRPNTHPPRPLCPRIGLPPNESERRARTVLLIGAAERARRCQSGQNLVDEEACWGPSSDDDFRAAARELLRLIEAHRKASQEQSHSTAHACEGLSDYDRDVSPFVHSADILRVEPISAGPHVDGARVFFRRVRGLSSVTFQRIVDCHIAQAQELGHDVRDETFCPLNPPDVRATVTDAPDGFVVDVTSTDPDAAREVLRRAMELTRQGQPAAGNAHGLGVTRGPMRSSDAG